MNGFVKNLSNTFMYALQRQWAPGQEVSLTELYDQYGKKHGLEEGPEFIAWLIGLKLPDRNKWQVVCDGQVIGSIEQANKLEKPKVDKKRKTSIQAIITKVSDNPLDLGDEITFPGEKISKESSEEVEVEYKDTTEVMTDLMAGDSVRRVDTVTGRPLGRKSMVLKKRIVQKPSIKKDLTPEDILNLRVVEIKETLKNVKDARILRIALKAAENKRNTATLCKLLRERLSELKYSHP